MNMNYSRFLALIVFIIAVIILCYIFPVELGKNTIFVEDDPPQAHTPPPPPYQCVPNIINETKVIIVPISESIYKKRHAIFTLITTNDFADASRTLAYSLLKVNTTGELIAMTMPAVNDMSKCLLKSAGWTVYPVQGVPAPRPPTLERWKDMFTKLLLWNLTEFDKIVYLDSDTVALRNFDEIFESPAEFSAVRDFNGDSFTWGFNAGMFVLKPNKEMFETIMREIHNVGNYNTGPAEQSFLNMWYEFKWLRLPNKYNANLAAYYSARHDWNNFGDIKVVHYTVTKPLGSIDPHDSNMDPIFKIYFEIYFEMLKTYTGSCDAVNK